MRSIRAASIGSRRLIDYESAAIPLVWVINPPSRMVRVYLPDGSSRAFGENDLLSDRDILIGFSVRVGDSIPLSTAVG